MGTPARPGRRVLLKTAEEVDTMLTQQVSTFDEEVRVRFFLTPELLLLNII